MSVIIPFSWLVFGTLGIYTVGVFTPAVWKLYQRYKRDKTAK